TGALGHIGSRLIRSFAESHPGAEVVLLDDLSAQRYVSLFDLPKGARYRFIEGDATKLDLLPLVQGADCVVHLAAITNAAASFENQTLVESVNFQATSRVAEACAASSVPMFYVSSTSVYGTAEDEVDEDSGASVLQPQSPYAETKLREEKLLAELGASRGLRFIACRFGTIFGTSPGMRFHTAVNKFCWQAVVGKPVTVWRTALHQVRPYLDLGDAVSAINFVVKGNRFDGRIYNVLTLNATVAEILAVIQERVSDLQIEYVDAKIMNQLSYRVLNRKFMGLGFQFSGDLGAGVRDTLRLLENARSGCTGGA
ncbi:MAG TPA: SDR family oxidoreductase, partial [Polyangiaceae bacterium]